MNTPKKTAVWYDSLVLFSSLYFRYKFFTLRQTTAKPLFSSPAASISERQLPQYQKTFCPQTNFLFHWTHLFFHQKQHTAFGTACICACWFSTLRPFDIFGKHQTAIGGCYCIRPVLIPVPNQNPFSEYRLPNCNFRCIGNAPFHFTLGFFCSFTIA